MTTKNRPRSFPPFPTALYLVFNPFPSFPAYLKFCKIAAAVAASRDGRAGRRGATEYARARKHINHQIAATGEIPAELWFGAVGVYLRPKSRPGFKGDGAYEIG